MSSRDYAYVVYLGFFMQDAHRFKSLSLAVIEYRLLSVSPRSKK
jgi:hypothetical protein